MDSNNLLVMESAEALYVRAAEEIVHLAGEAICTHGEFTICLTGGSTPAPIYELLATRFELSVDWKEVQFFWGDERCVPPDDPESNFRMANRAMLSKLALRPQQIHRMRGEAAPDAAARDYRDELQRFFNLASDSQFPSFNLILLGLGENAHVASLFPHHPALHSRELVVAVEVEAKTRRRISLTMPVINYAQRVMFLVGGQSKAEAVHNVLQGPRDPEEYPAQFVQPENGEVVWMVDRAAAGRLA